MVQTFVLFWHLRQCIYPRAFTQFFFNFDSSIRNMYCSVHVMLNIVFVFHLQVNFANFFRYNEVFSIPMFKGIDLAFLSAKY
jgi:hypothetical protein